MFGKLENKNIKKKLVFFSPECKELRSHCSILTSKTLNKFKNQQFSSEEVRSLGKLESQMNTENCNLLEQKPKRRNLHWKTEPR